MRPIKAGSFCRKMAADYASIRVKMLGRTCLIYAVSVTVFVYVVFDRLISVPWPNTILGHIFPVLANWVPSM